VQPERAGFHFLGVGGTSASAPAFAGIMALVNQFTKASGRATRTTSSTNWLPARAKIAALQTQAALSHPDAFSTT